MTIELSLALFLSLIGPFLAALALWRQYQRDHQGDVKQWEIRLRVLEDERLKVEEFMRSRANVLDRINQIERELIRSEEFLEILRIHLPRLMRDVAKGQRS